MTNVENKDSNIKLYDKLVRDRIPEVIERRGGSCEVKVVCGEEKTGRLEEKLQEEVQEYLKDKNLEELADIMEVLFGLAKSLGYSEEQLLGKRLEKREERGGFEEGLVLLKVYEENKR